jgi:hypothetical protein
MPMLVAAEKEYSARGVVFIAASLDDRKNIPAIPAFRDKYQIPFPVWTGATATHLDKLRLGEAVPATAFIDRDGSISARVSGQVDYDAVKQRLDWLLSDRSSPPPAPFISTLAK